MSITERPVQARAGARRPQGTSLSTALRRAHRQLLVSVPDRSANSIFAVGLVAVLGIAIFDVASDTNFSHAFLYVLPVVAVTMLTSSRRGVLLAAVAAVAWVVADALEPGGYSWHAFEHTQIAHFASFAVIVLLLAVLRDALGEANAADTRSRAFLADAAHQLRTPAASIQACAETLVMGPDDDTREQLLMLVANEAQRMSRLTNALLQIARLDQGEETVPRPVDIAALCIAEVELTRHRAGPAITVDVVTPAHLDPVVILDPNATREALANLLDNARRHACSSVIVHVERRGGELFISVADDGPGLPPGNEERAFDRFASLDGQGGSGLGLPIARAYVEVQGGTLTYERAAFVMRLPLK